MGDAVHHRRSLSFTLATWLESDGVDPSRAFPKIARASCSAWCSGRPWPRFLRPTIRWASDFIPLLPVISRQPLYIVADISATNMGTCGAHKARSQYEIGGRGCTGKPAFVLDTGSASIDLAPKARTDDPLPPCRRGVPQRHGHDQRPGRNRDGQSAGRAVFGYAARRAFSASPVEMLLPDRFRGHHPRLRSTSSPNPNRAPWVSGRDPRSHDARTGSEFPIEIGLNPIETEEGTMVLSAIVDISERKRLGGAVPPGGRGRAQCHGDDQRRRASSRW